VANHCAILAVRAAATLGAGAALLLGGCSSAAHHDVSPLPTTAAAQQDFCGPVSKPDIVTALGATKFSQNGSIQQLDASEKTNPDGTRLAMASCHVFTNSASGEALTVDVTQIGIQRDADAQLMQIVQDRKADYYYPRNVGIGYANYGQTKDRNDKTHRNSGAAVLWGDWRITVLIDAPANWRDPLKDAVAISEQVGHRLALPSQPTMPYPTPTSS